MFESCAKIVYLAIAPQKVKTEELKKCNGGEECRSVVLIPMVHIAKPKFYKQVKNEVEKLKSNGTLLFMKG